MNKKYRLKTDEEFLASGWEQVITPGVFSPGKSKSNTSFVPDMRTTYLAEYQIHNVAQLKPGNYAWINGWCWTPEMFIEEKVEEREGLTDLANDVERIARQCTDLTSREVQVLQRAAKILNAVNDLTLKVES